MGRLKRCLVRGFGKSNLGLEREIGMKDKMVGLRRRNLPDATSARTVIAMSDAFIKFESRA